MKIELKKIYFSSKLSEETSAFTADLYVDGKIVGYVKNDGRGSATYYHASGGLNEWDVIRAAEKYCLTLPPLVFSWGKIDMDLEHYIDHLFNEWLKAKDIKRMEKKGLVFEKDGNIETIKWKGFTLSELILKHPQGKFTVQQQIAKLKKDKWKILNTNLQELGINL